jgi:phosphohistidine phosphatase SixA
MTDKRILLMRHAEKPVPDDDPHLSAIGEARAERLPARIATILNGPVNFIFAAKSSAHSARPVETVTPLAQSTKLDIDENWTDNDYAELAAHLLSEAIYAGTNIVVCWHHEMIPPFAKALGATVGSIFVAKWPPDEFNRILSFQYQNGADPLTKAID